MIQLRPYQDAGVSDIREAFRDGSRAVLYVLPTGGGKTVVFAHISAQTIARAKKVLILVHREELLRQTIEALNRADVEYGAIHPAYRVNMFYNVQVGSVQTLVNRMERYSFVPDLIIVDECHHASANSWRQIFEYYSTALILGVTATPIRENGYGLGKGVGGFFDTMVLGPTVKELIADGYLVPPKVYSSFQQLNFSSVRVSTETNDYNTVELELKMNVPTITGNAVKEYSQICPGVACIVFCVTVNHAERVAKQFREAGFRFYAVDGKMKDDERKAILDALATGQIDGVTSCDLISEGFDTPAVSCIVSLRPTISTGLFLQQCGRGARPFPGKQFYYLLDHAGNVLRHGMPDDDRTWSLDGERKKRRVVKVRAKSKPKMKQCDQCDLIHAPARECPGCGNIYGLQEEALIELNGELVQVTEEMAAAIKAERIQEVANAKTMHELEAIAADRGYKRGWAKRIYEAREKIKRMSENNQSKNE